MRGDQQYWRVLHSIEKVMKGRQVLNYSHRCRREVSVLDSLWNRFLDHAHAAGSSDEDITPGMIWGKASSSRLSVPRRGNRNSSMIHPG